MRADQRAGGPRSVPHFATEPGNRSGTNSLGREARNNTTHTQSRTTSLNKNSPVRFHAIGSVEKLHFTTPGVEKKNDQVMQNVPIPISAPNADAIGIKAPAARSAAVVSSMTPSKSASPLTPKIESQETKGLFEI